MNKVLCNKNHYYDADKFSACPHCARAKAFLERTRTGAARPHRPPAGAPARDGYWSLDDLRGKTSLPDTPAPGFSAPLPQEPSGLNIMHTTPLFPPDGCSCRFRLCRSRIVRAAVRNCANSSRFARSAVRGRTNRLRLRPHPYRSSRRAVRAAVRNCANGSRFARSAACG